MTLRIGVATDDGKTVKRGDFSESKFFAIYDLTGRTPTRVELRPNPLRGKSKDPMRVLRILGDCDVIISMEFAPESIKDMEAKGIIAHETKKRDVDKSVLEFAEELARLGVRS